jgi:hypothetical protein
LVVAVEESSVERGVGGIQDADLVVVLAVGRAQVPVPGVGHAADAAGDGVVGFVDRLLGIEAQGERDVGRHLALDHVGQAIVLVRGAPLLGDSAEAVDLDVGRDLDAAVVGQHRLAVLGVAGDAVHIGPVRRVDDLRIALGRAVGGAGVVDRVHHARVVRAAEAVAVVLGLAGQVQVGILGRRHADIGGEVAGGAAAVDIAAAGDDHLAAGRGLLLDDVDDAGDGVGAVLGGRAFQQHFDVVDRGQRDEVQVGGRAALIGAAQDGQVGRAVTALAVQQDQGVVGADAAQLGRQGQGGGVAAEGLGVERRDVLGQGLDQVRLAGLLEDVGAQHGDRRGAVDGLHAGGARPGDDDGLEFGDIGRRLRRLGRISIDAICKAMLAVEPLRTGCSANDYS